MKTVALLYDTSCIYEIVILNYFLKVTGKEMQFVSLDGKEITATEGYRIVPEDRLDSADPKDVELLVIPGGDIEKIDIPEVWKYLKSVKGLGGRIAAICAGVDVVEHAGLLEGIESTHSGEKDVVTSDRITTSRANGYVDFAIEVAKQMELFEDEADLQETIAFWLEQDPCIFDLGNWILRTALTDVQKLREETEGFFVNVNVAAAQLERREFRSAVMNILKETGAKPEELCLELTERCRDLDIHFLRGEVEFFHSQGIKIALDDFGTGNSSLSLALELPFDELKVDMSFIRDIKQKPQNQAMVQSIVDYARRTNTETCIEGIEDKEVSDYIEKFGSTWQQGYYYSKPVPIEQFEEVLREKATEKE